MAKDMENRRPLAVRQTKFAQKTASWLAHRSITPNQISIASVAFSLLSFLACLAYGYLHQNIIFLIISIFGIQMRLLCNLFDGMVAIEGNKKSDVGELFNDLPDRIADPLIIIGFLFLCRSDIGATFVWLSALGSILTAYIRILGVSMGQAACFIGPMAKQHRMALMTLAIVLMILCQLFYHNNHINSWIASGTMIIMFIGIVITCTRRVLAIYHS